MVDRRSIEKQMHKIGFNPFTWGRSEVAELCNILMDNEEIVECVNGEYYNGFALLVATNHRILLVDKKPFLFLTVEDVRFEQISDFNYRNKFLTANITVSTANKTLHFSSYNKKRLRKLIGCVQQRVISLRELQSQTSQRSIETAAAPPVPAAPSPVASVAQEPVSMGQDTAVVSSVLTQEQTPEPALAAPVEQPKSHAPIVGGIKKQGSRLATYTRARLPALHRNAAAAEGSNLGPFPDYRMPSQY